MKFEEVSLILEKTSTKKYSIQFDDLCYKSFIFKFGDGYLWDIHECVCNKVKISIASDVPFYMDIEDHRIRMSANELIKIINQCKILPSNEVFDSLKKEYDFRQLNRPNTYDTDLQNIHALYNMDYEEIRKMAGIPSE
jgi:hypothetical protein